MKLIHQQSVEIFCFLQEKKSELFFFVVFFFFPSWALTMLLPLPVLCASLAPNFLLEWQNLGCLL